MSLKTDIMWGYYDRNSYWEKKELELLIYNIMHMSVVTHRMIIQYSLLDSLNHIYLFYLFIQRLYNALCTNKYALMCYIV